MGRSASLLAIGTLAGLQATAALKFYDQCGGVTYTGETQCPSGSECVESDSYYSACRPTEPGWGQCGGLEFQGTEGCSDGWKCVEINDYYSQCQPDDGSASTPSVPSSSNATPIESASSTAVVVPVPETTTAAEPIPETTDAESSVIASPSSVVEGVTTTEASNSDATSATSAVDASETIETSIASTVASSASAVETAAASPTTIAESSSSVVPSSSAAVPTVTPIETAPDATGFLGGVNLAGFDFGMEVWGWSGTFMAPPMDQINHFVSQGVNVIRLPFGWQYMESSPGAGLKADFFAQYDKYVQAALSAGTYVILDLHNYGRWNSGVVGKDGPTTAQFASLWGALAGKYAAQPKVMFGLMNEPHDMDIGEFAKGPMQSAVNAIRAAGAKTNKILLPAGFWSHADHFISDSKAALSAVTDPAGGTANLIFDLHQYLDGNGSGTSTECVTDQVAGTWEPVAADLRASRRKAIVTEIGGGSTSSCATFLKAALASIKKNSDVYLGFTAWAAGSFSAGYELNLTPSGGSDVAIWTEAIKPNLPSSRAAKLKRENSRGHDKRRLH